MKKRIRIFDSNFAHSKAKFGYDSSSTLKPKHIEWVREGEGEGGVTFFTDKFITSPIVDQTPGIRIAWLLEPYEYTPAVYRDVLEVANKFNVILTYNQELIDVLSNAYKIPFGGCWIKEQDWRIYEKTKLVSMIASKKKLTAGHLVRHHIVDMCKDNPALDVYGEINNNYIEDKLTGLKDYRFSIVIENDKSTNFFTEKLIDCFLTGTIPIYWGCPNIDHIFDGSGLIQITKMSDFENETWHEQLPDYDEMLPAINNNFNLAQSYVSMEDWIWKNILASHFSVEK